MIPIAAPYPAFLSVTALPAPNVCIYIYCTGTIVALSAVTVENNCDHTKNAAVLTVHIVIFVLNQIIKKKKIGRYILYFIILLILTVGQATLGYFVYKTYSSINNINKDKITYSTSLVVRTDSKIEELKDLKDKKIILYAPTFRRNMKSSGDKIINA